MVRDTQSVQQAQGKENFLGDNCVFVGKNIDWKLPSMKLVVSIMLYCIPSLYPLSIYNQVQKQRQLIKVIKETVFAGLGSDFR